jgi:probable H4MPT-linked C1 transfer pathway protein
MPTPDALVIGWDIGGAHLKACRMRSGRVVDVAQWACPLWLGLDRLDTALQAAFVRWPDAIDARHAVTMTGEMTDLFAHREQGVQRIAALLASALPEPSFFAGDAGWCSGDSVARHWADIASANWLATATHVARELGSGRLTGERRGEPMDQQPSGVLVDIGSTTTDLIAFRDGRVLTTARSDAQRLASSELVYHGVVRTPLCALARRIVWRGADLNVMNEFFATVADVYRLTGELDPAHDLHPAADNAGKDIAATQRRLARMIGLDARDGTDDEWLAFARNWRAAQVAELGGQLRRVIDGHGLADTAIVVSAGCGDFLLPDLVAQAGAGRPFDSVRTLAYGRDVARVAAPAATRAAVDVDTAAVAAWAQVCAPSVAVAALLDREQR